MFQTQVSGATITCDRAIVTRFLTTPEHIVGIFARAESSGSPRITAGVIIGTSAVITCLTAVPKHVVRIIGTFTSPSPMVAILVRVATALCVTTITDEIVHIF